MMGALLRGVSTREYAEVLPEMAETAGVSRSSISRQAIEGSVEQLRQLRERRWDQADLLVLYVDGQRFGSHHVISAVGVDRAGVKHVLGIELGATENAAAVKQLLTNLRDQGLPTDRTYLFVIDGAKALRACIAELLPACCHAQSGQQVSLAGATVPDEQHRLSTLNVSSFGQLAQLRRTHLRTLGEVELVQRFHARQMCFPNAPFHRIYVVTRSPSVRILISTSR